MEGVRVRHQALEEEEEVEELEQGLLSLFAGAAGGGSSSDDDDEEQTRPSFVTETYTRKDPKADPAQLELSLAASHHSLWGHKVWNAAKVLGEIIESDPSLVQGKACLELGAGAALPSLLAALNGARHAVASDYASSSDQVLVGAMQRNIDRLLLAGIGSSSTVVAEGVLSAVGYIWGQPVAPLLAPLRENKEGKFDVILCADLIFNRSEHKKLLWTCRECLGEGGQVLVSYSHHDPEKQALDMVFFTLAVQDEEDGMGGWVVEDIKTEQCVDLFVENDGLDEARGKVYVKRLTRRRQAS